jgi:hypothetical protein
MSDLLIKGVVTHIMPIQSGESKAGKPYQKQEFAIETQEQFPRTVGFLCFGDKVSLISAISEGQEVTVHFNLESRIYNDKFFHNINAWKIEASAKPASVSASSGLIDHSQNAPTPEVPDDGGDLPF